MVKVYKKNGKIHLFGHSESYKICSDLTVFLKNYEKKSVLKLVDLKSPFNIYRLDFLQDEHKFLRDFKEFCDTNKKNIKLLCDLIKKD